LDFWKVRKTGRSRVKSKDVAFGVGSNNGFGNVVEKGLELFFFVSEAGGGLVEIDNDVREGLV
jgi:hypothetical protein